MQSDSKVTILYYDDDYGKDISSNIEKRFEQLQEDSQIVKEIIRKNIDVDNVSNHEPHIKNSDVVIIITNGNSRTTIIPLVKMAQEEEEALIISPDSAFNSFTIEKQDSDQCRTEGLLVITPNFDKIVSQDIENFIKAKAPMHKINSDILDNLSWQKLELQDWRITYSYVAANSILWVNQEDYSDGAAVQNKYTNKVQFDDQNGDLIINNDSIATFEVSSECEFKRK